MGKWIFLIFLVWAVWQDLRSRTVGQGFLAAAGSLGAAVSLLSGRSVPGLLSSAAVGIFLLILGQITDGGIGEGDGWFFIVTGFFLEPTENFMLFLSGLIFCSVYSLAYMAASFIGGVGVRAEKASVPPLSASSGTLAGAFLKKERRLAASFTVEAALVLGLVFMVMGMTIKEAYTIHDEITGSMILEEALERASYNRDEKKEDTYFTGQAEEQGNPRLWLGKYSARLKRKTGKISGYASAGAWALEIERGAFRPELFLRRTAALTEMGNGQDDGGSGVQTGNEPELYGPEAGTGEK